MNGLLLISNPIGTPLYSRPFSENYGLPTEASSSHATTSTNTKPKSTGHLSSLSLSGLMFSLRVQGEGILVSGQDGEGMEFGSGERPGKGISKSEQDDTGRIRVRFSFSQQHHNQKDQDNLMQDSTAKLEPHIHVSLEQEPPTTFQQDNQNSASTSNVETTPIASLHSITFPELQLSMSQYHDALSCLLHQPNLSLHHFSTYLARYFQEHYPRQCHDGITSRRLFRKVVIRELKQQAGREISKRVVRIVKQLGKYWRCNWMYLCYSHRFCDEMDALMEKETQRSDSYYTTGGTLHREEHDFEFSLPSLSSSNHSPRNSSPSTPSKPSILTTLRSNSPLRRFTKRNNSSSPVKSRHATPILHEEAHGIMPGSPANFTRETPSRVARPPPEKKDSNSFSRSSMVPKPPPGKPPSKPFRRRHAPRGTLRRFSTYITDFIFRRRKNRSKGKQEEDAKPQTDYYFSELAGEFQLYYSAPGLFRPLQDSHHFEKALSVFYESARMMAQIGDSVNYLEIQCADLLEGGQLRKDRSTAVASNNLDCTSKMIFYRFGHLFVFFPVGSGDAEGLTDTEKEDSDELNFVQQPSQPHIRQLIHQDLKELHEFIDSLQNITKFHYDIQLHQPSKETLHENLRTLNSGQKAVEG